MAANRTLRAVRVSLRLSQDEFARRLRDEGIRLGEPNEASKRLVQRWESGEVSYPRSVYARALEAVTGLPVEQLGFHAPVVRVRADGAGGYDVESDPVRVMAAARPRVENYSGIWRSRYEYFSSGRGDTFTGEHQVVLVQRGDRISARSVASDASALALDLSVDRNVVTGTWSERTDAAGYYHGAVYHGAIQLLVEPTGRRMVGKWVGFGKEFDVNTGPWELVFVEKG